MQDYLIIILAGGIMLGFLIVTEVTIGEKIRARTSEGWKLARFAILFAGLACVTAGLCAFGLKAVPLFGTAMGGDSPIGTVIAWPGEEDTVPEGWVVCKGQPIDDDIWAGNELRKVIGKSALPNYQGYFLRGAGGLSSARSTSERLKRSTTESSVRVGEEQHDQASLNIYHPNIAERNMQRLIPGTGGYAVFELKQISNGAGIWEPGRHPDGVYVPTLHRANGAPDAIPMDFETRPANIAVNWIMRVK